MIQKRAKQIAQEAIAKARVAGWWCVSFDRKGRAVRMFVPAK